MKRWFIWLIIILFIMVSMTLSGEKLATLPGIFNRLEEKGDPVTRQHMGRKIAEIKVWMTSTLNGVILRRVNI